MPEKNLKAKSEPKENAVGAVPRVGIVLVHYNCFEDTLRCIESLRALEYPDFFLVLVDNYSSDDSGLRLQFSSHAEDVELLVLNPENKGFAAANNVGISNAKVQGAEVVWLLNPDTTVSPNSLRELVSALTHNEDIAAVGSKVLYGSEDSTLDTRGQRVWSAGAEIDFALQELSMRGNDVVDEGQFDQAVDTDYLPGCSMLVPFSTIERIGFMPEDYFMYFEETEWCTRMKHAGLTLRYEPKSVIWHHFDDSKMQQAFTVYYYNRNSRLFWFRFGTLKQRGALVLNTLFKALPSALRAFFAAPNAESRALFRAHILSCTDFLFGRFGKREDLNRRSSTR